MHSITMFVIFYFYAILCLGRIGCFAFTNAPIATRATIALRRSNLYVRNRYDFIEKSMSATDGKTNIKFSSRRLFLNTMLVGFFPSISNAVEFVPASPSFQGTLADAEEIISAQRLALNNIADVIRQGDIDEAGFKIMQLISQTKVGGEITLATFQEQLPSKGSTALLRYQSCQKKFVYLMESFDDCKIAYENALKGKLGSTAAAQLKLLSIIDTSKSLYDEFLLELNLFKSEY